MLEQKEMSLHSRQIIEPDIGRAKVIPVNCGLEIPPVQVVKVEWQLEQGYIV